jgi:Na+/phosphate symporter
MMIGDVVATLYMTFFIRYISIDASIIVYIGLSLNVLACIMAFWLVESPAWLVSVNRKEEAIEKLKYMAKFNGV